MPQKLIDQTTIQPDGRPGDDAFTAFATCNDNFQDAEGRLSALEAGGQDVEDLKVALQQEKQLRDDADTALSQAIAAEVTARQNADTALGARFIGKNVLINGGFGIWQRGNTFTSTAPANSSDAKYSADRWLINAGAGASITLTANVLNPADYDQVQNSGKALPKTEIAISGGAGHYAVMEQRIENVHTMQGKQVTVSMRVFAPTGTSRQIAIEFVQNFRSGTPAVTGIGSKVFSIGAGWTTIVHTLTVPSTAGKTAAAGDNLALTIWFSGGSDWNSRNAGLGQQPNGVIYVTDVQVEQGPVATAFENRNAAAELALCQRYYEKTYDLSNPPGTAINNGRRSIAMGAAGSNFIFFAQAFTVRKRAWPTVTVYPAPGPGPSGAGNIAQDDGSMRPVQVQNIGTYGFEMQWSNTSGRYGGWFHWVADAEI